MIEDIDFMHKNIEWKNAINLLTKKGSLYGYILSVETDSAVEWTVQFYTKHGYTVFKEVDNPWG